MNNLNTITRRTSRSRSGSMLVFIAVIMVIFLIAAAFCVDVAYMHVVKAELRTATDAAARAGAETLARTQDQSAAIAAAIQIAEANKVAGDGLTLDPSEVVVGGINVDANGKLTFVAGQNPLTSIQIVGRRDSTSPDNTVPLFFGRLFEREAFSPLLDASASSSVRDIALVLDRSGSMGDAMGSGTRLSALIDAVNVFIDEIEVSSPYATLSLTTYASGSTRDIALTENFLSIRDAVNNLTAAGNTNIFEGIQQGSDSLEEDPNRRQYSEKSIVVMTDGNFNDGGTPVPSANVAASRNQLIHTITFSPEANQDIMIDVADIGGGMHIHADDAGDLSEAFREIAKALAVVLID